MKRRPIKQTKETKMKLVNFWKSVVMLNLVRDEKQLKDQAIVTCNEAKFIPMDRDYCMVVYEEMTVICKQENGVIIWMEEIPSEWAE